MGGRPPTVVPCHYRASSSVVLPSCRPAVIVIVWRPVLSCCRRLSSCRPVVLSSAVLCCRGVWRHRLAPCHPVARLPGHLFASGHLGACSRLSHSRPSFARSVSTIHPLQIHLYCEHLLVFEARLNPVISRPNFTDSMHFLARLFSRELLTSAKRALQKVQFWETLVKISEEKSCICFRHRR